MKPGPRQSPSRKQGGGLGKSCRPPRPNARLNVGAVLGTSQGVGQGALLRLRKTGGEAAAAVKGLHGASGVGRERKGRPAGEAGKSDAQAQRLAWVKGVEVPPAVGAREVDEGAVLGKARGRGNLWLLRNGQVPRVDESARHPVGAKVGKAPAPRAAGANHPGRQEGRLPARPRRPTLG